MQRHHHFDTLDPGDVASGPWIYFLFFVCSFWTRSLRFFLHRHASIRLGSLYFIAQDPHRLHQSTRRADSVARRLPTDAPYNYGESQSRYGVYRIAWFALECQLASTMPNRDFAITHRKDGSNLVNIYQ